MSREYEALSRPCKCTSTLYTRVRATALNTVTSQVRLMLVSLHTHSHGENITDLIPSTSTYVDLSPCRSQPIDLSPCRSQPIDFSPWQQIVSWILNRYLAVWWSQVGRCTCHGWVYGHGWCPDRLDVVCPSVWHAWWSLAICSQFFNYQCQIMSMSPQYE